MAMRALCCSNLKPSPLKNSKNVSKTISSERANRWISLLRVLLILVALIPLIYAVLENWDELILVFSDLEWRRYLVSQLILVPIFPFIGIVSWVVVRRFKPDLKAIKIVRFYFISQIAKYLPGGFWAIPGRVLLYVTAGVPQAQGAVSVFREISAVFIGAALVGGFGLILGLPITEWMRNVIGIGLFAAILIIILTQFPIFWIWLNRIPLLKSATENLAQLEGKNLNLVWLVQACGVSVVFWALLGIPFRILVLAVSPEAANLHWMEAAAIFSLSWCAGFVVLVAPAGLGIRETVLAILLSSFIPRADALAVALLARLWWIAGETVWIVTSLVLKGEGQAR
jgi:uncharacterized membrane protein YbhN (UPF0104 family)